MEKINIFTYSSLVAVKIGITLLKVFARKHTISHFIIYLCQDHVLIATTLFFGMNGMWM